MIREVLTTIVPKRVGEEILVAKVHKGTAPNRWLAQRVINAVRAKVPLEQIACDVVVMDGEMNEQQTIIGTSPDAEIFVRRISPELATYRWQLMKLEW
jgi:hypothetical protein